MLRSQQGTPPAAAPRQLVTILVDMGLNAKESQRWDGRVSLQNAKLVSAAGRHFSEGDTVSPDGAWKCTTRRDIVAPWSDIHYTEMRPGSVPAEHHMPVGVFLTLDPDPGARFSIETARGNVSLGLDEIGAEPKPFADGAASVRRVSTAEKLTTSTHEDDEPSIAALPDGSVAVAWVAYKDKADSVMFRLRQSNGTWAAPEEVSGRGDIFRVSVVASPDGKPWVVWNQREGSAWRLWMRQRQSANDWGTVTPLPSAGSATFHRAAIADKLPAVVSQNFDASTGKSDIYLNNTKVSDSPANDWEPAIAVGRDGSVHMAWDSYDRGNYDIHYRSLKNGQLSPLRRVTTSARFQAHASVAVDDQDRAWIAWNESGVNWGKDQGFLLAVPLATPLHQERSIRVAVWNGTAFVAPAQQPPSMGANAEHPVLSFSNGSLVMVFRHWTRRVSRSIGSAMTWQNYVTTFDGTRWSTPQPLPDAGTWIEKPAQLALDASGAVWAAWMHDNRPFSTCVPGNADVFAARLTRAPQGRFNAESLVPFSDPDEEAIPTHSNEGSDVGAIRAYRIATGGRQYRIFRGDMHRHTDISQDFKYDGSLFEVYRYAMDAAGFDYIAPTDHQTGYDQEFSWWQHEKYVDLFVAGDKFVPIFGYERSLPYPNGHRNVIRPQRGVRPLPFSPDEFAGREGAAKLFAHLKQTNAISMPHSSATQQGTDWRDNDPQVEPLVEIYQGYRTSYEYEGAPRAATALNPHAQKSGWQPSGFYWNALDKGYKLGVQASSDHWSTHISYACLLVEQPTREGMMDAIRKRHAYAATDNIVLDYRASLGAREYIQGDMFTAGAGQTPRFVVRVQGTNAIKQVDLISNRRHIYTSRPGTKWFNFEFTDRNAKSGESWYYVRVLQEDGQLAWSSPIWVTR